MIIGIDASRANLRERTGTERYAFEVIKRLPARLPNVEIRLYTRERPLADMPPESSQLHYRVLQWRPGLLWSHLRLSWELWRHPVDLLFVPADTVPIVHPRLTATTIHDVAFERFPELYRGRSVQRRLGWLRPVIHLLVRLVTLGRYSASERDYHRWSARHAVRSSPILFTVSEFSKQEIVNTLAAQPERITVTPLGVALPSEFVGPKQQAVSTVFPALTDTSYVLYIGRLEKKKNIVTLLQAFQRYRNELQGTADLVLVGQPGFGWSEAETLLAEQSFAAHVHQLGWQSDDHVRLLQAHARATVCISRYEGFGIPPLESLSAAVPVLASRAGSLPEVLGEAALYTDLDDPAVIAHDLWRITTDETLRAVLVQRGLERVTRYSWDETTARTAERLQVAGLQKGSDYGTVTP